MKNIKNLKKNKKGFTLVEIIVVLVIIGILMALAVPAVMKYVNQAADTKVQSQVRAAFTAAQANNTSYVGEHPGETDDKLVLRLTGTNGVTNVNQELGIEKNTDGKWPEGAATKVECTLTNKKVDSCVIAVEGSTEDWTATQTSITK